MMPRLLRRLLFGALTVFGIYTLTFLMVVTVPGNPFQQGQHRMAPETEMAFRARYHMDNNWLYYWEFLRSAVQLDFGPAFSYTDWTCNQVIAASLPVSVLIGLLAILTAVMVGVPLGVLAACRRNSWIDVSCLAVIVLGISVPTFVTGTTLIVVFCVLFKWLPIGGWGGFLHIPLPVFTLALPFIAYIARLTRSAMSDVLSQDFIRTARAKGLPSRTVIWKHALKPALLPVIGYLGPATAQAMTGSFVVEKVFGVPGIGQHFVNAALNRDAGLIMSTVLVFATLLVAMNLVVDLVYTHLDPRIREAV
jgi:oligopeptide transport system permease protein